MILVGVISLAYLLIGLTTIRPLAGHFAWHMCSSYQSKPDGEQWFGAIAGASVLAFVWPATIVFFLVGWRGPVIGAEREAQMRAREERIREAERELGIVP